MTSIINKTIKIVSVIFVFSFFTISILTVFPSMAADKKLEVRKVLNDADIFMINGQIKKAEKKYFEAIGVLNEGRIWAKLADFYDYTKQYKKALKITQNIRKNFPDSVSMIMSVHNRAVTELGLENEIPLYEIKEHVKPAEKIITQTVRKGCFTKKGYVYAGTEGLFKQAFDLLMANDTEALAKLTLITGNIGLTKENVKVEKKSAGFLSGRIKIRPTGSPYWLWTSQEAVECNR